MDPWKDARYGALHLVKARWFTVAAATALTLGIGSNTITAFSVDQRAREIGIRIALGAQPRQMSWLSLRRSLGYLAIGLPVEILGALGVGQLLRSILVISPTDPLTLADIVLLLAVVSLVVCLIPARRAARLDPMVALRVE